MQAESSGTQPPRKPPESRKNRAPPLEPDVVEGDSWQASLPTTPKKKTRPEAALVATQDKVDTQSVAEGTPQPQSFTEKVTEPKLAKKSRRSKQRRLPIDEEDPEVVEYVQEYLRNLSKNFEKLLGLSSEGEGSETSEEGPRRPEWYAKKLNEQVEAVFGVEPRGEGTDNTEDEWVTSQAEEGSEAADIAKKTKRKRKMVEGVDGETDAAGLKKTKRKRTSRNEKGDEEGEDARKPNKTKRKRKAKDEKGDEEGGQDADIPKKPKQKRKTKEEKEAEAMPIAARTPGLNMFIGAHVSCAKGPLNHEVKLYKAKMKLMYLSHKGVHNSVTNCLHIGGNAFAMFLKSQRKWENPPLLDDHKDQFLASCTEHKHDAASHILPHGSYLVNLAQEDPEKHAQSYNAFLDDLHRCEALGIKLYNFHPGWTGPTATRESALTRIASSLNRAHAATSTVTPVLETMAGSGSVIGSIFSDLASVIAQVDNKSRIGVCMDTCHVFAAGYDLRSPSTFMGVMDEFDRIVGLKYLKALHLNDSKAPFGSHRDLHANIGTGFVGLRAFHNVMNEKRFEGLPMVLETPTDRKDPENEGKTIEDKRVWAGEIKMLEDLVGMDTEGEDFKKMEGILSERGKEERDKHWEQYERKLEKEAKAAEKSKGKGKKRGNETGQGKQTTLKWRSSKVDGPEVAKDSSGSELSSIPSDDSS